MEFKPRLVRSPAPAPPLPPQQHIIPLKRELSEEKTWTKRDVNALLAYVAQYWKQKEGPPELVWVKAAERLVRAASDCSFTYYANGGVEMCCRR